MRAFFAVNLPPELKADVYAAFEPVRMASMPVRWVTAESLHITLSFLGSVSEAERDRAIAAAHDAAADLAPFTVSLQGAGVFPNVRAASVWWIGCVSPGLVALQSGLAGHLKRAGFPKEGRTYSQHVTTGRTKRDARAGGTHVASLLERVAVSASWRASSFELMQSNISPRGAQYRVVESFELTGEM